MNVRRKELKKLNVMENMKTTRKKRAGQRKLSRKKAKVTAA